jgi:hypothetical protein
MQNSGKIYLTKIDALTFVENFFAKLKYFIRDVFPLIIKSGFGVIFLLILQVSIVGLFDRFGVSPKISFLISSVVLSAVSVSLAMIGGINFAETADKIVVGKLNQPICKILIIRKKGVQKI